MVYRRWRSRPHQRGGGPSSWGGLLGLVLAVAAVVYLPLPVLNANFNPQRAGAGPLLWLSTRHGQIVDSAGRTVLLRGFNDDALLQVGRSSPPPPLTASDAALMQAEGFDVVRLPISWSLLEPAPGRFSQGYLRRIADLVSLCALHHLYVVLDMHTEDFGVGFGGSGAPAWLKVPEVPNLKVPLVSAAWQRHLSPAVNAALAYFWLFPNWQALYWNAWSRVAAEFRDNSAIAGYDLYNEPHPFPVPPAIFETHLLWPFYARGIKELSAVDPNHLFIVEGDLFGGLPTAIRPLAARDLVYSTHLYSGSILPPNFDGNSNPLRAELKMGLSEAAQLPAAYWAGELGIDHHRPIATAWARAEIALSNQYRTGWAWWQWNDPGGWGVRRGTAPPDTGWLDVLAQPFVRSAPGTMTNLRYNSETETLTAKVRDAGTDHTVIVSWPASLGPPRSVSGCARLSSAYLPASGQIRVQLASASCEIELRG